MKKKSLFILFGFLFGLCGAFCFNLPFQNTYAASTTASVWDGSTPQNENQMSPGEWWYDGDYHINSASALAYFRYLVNSSRQSFAGEEIFLETDVDLANHDWTPIGQDASKYFAGVFDGQGHTVFNVNLDGRGTGDYGFFGDISSSSIIKNLNLSNIQYDIQGAENVGGIVGSSAGGQIENCSVQGQISVTSADGNSSKAGVGGLAGCSTDTNVGKSMAKVDITISSSRNASVGGLVGYAQTGDFENSYFSGSVSANSSCSSCTIGGLVGEMRAAGNRLVNCFNVGALDGSSSTTVGGLVGRMNVSSARFSIENCYNAGEISWSSSSQGSYIGGLVGFVRMESASGQGSISNSFTIGEMTGAFRQEVSPLFNASTSDLRKTTFENTYFDSKLLPENSLSGATEEMLKCGVNDLSYYARTRDFYRNTKYFGSDWAFEDDYGWTIGSANKGLPFFNFVAGSCLENKHDGNNDQELSTNNKSFRGIGTAENPYLIYTAADLALLSEKTANGEFMNENPEGRKDADGNLLDGTYYFSLENDINLVGKDWVPIGFRGTSRGNPFTGVFDGNGHTISGLYSSNPEGLGYQGLFGRTYAAVIKNLIISDFKFVTPNASTANLIGSVAGQTFIVNCVDENSAKTVGIIEGGTLCVVYGRNNLSDIEFGGSEQTLNLSGMTYSKGYEVSLCSEGGTFYNRYATMQNMAAGMYLGEYHLLVNQYGNVLAQDIDKTFGAEMPGLSTGLGKKDILIKRGNKLRGYKKQNSYGDDLVYTVSTNAWQGGSSRFSQIKTDVVQGLCAVWDSQDGQRLKVVYNAYELAKLHAQQKSQMAYIGQNVIDENGKSILDGTGRGVTFKLGSTGNERGQIYVEYILEYDTVLFENEYIFNEPYYSVDNVETQRLRGGDFDMVGIFTSFNSSSGTFSGQLTREKSNVLVNEDLPETLYAQWKGVEEKNSTIKFTFKSNDKTFDLADAVDSMTMNCFENSSGLDPESSTAAGEETDEGYAISFQYNTLYSDTYEKFINFNLEMNGGYSLATNGIKFDGGNVLDVSKVDINFGNPWTSADNLVDVADLESFNQLNFYNLRGNHEIEIEVERELYQDRVELSDENIFAGVGSTKKLTISGGNGRYSSNVQISRENGQDMKDLVEFLRSAGDAQSEDFDKLIQNGEMFFTFDLVNNAIIFGTDDYDALELDFASYTDRLTQNCTFYIHVNDETLDGTTYCFMKENTSEYGVQYRKITVKNVTLDKNEVEYWLNNQDSRDSFIRYRAFDSFVMMFSTEHENTEQEETTSFTDIGALNYDVNDAGLRLEATSLKRFAGNPSGKTTKFLFRYEDTYHLTRGMGDEAPRIVVVTEYVKASFDIRFVHKDHLNDTKSNGLEKGSPRLLYQSVKQVEAKGDQTSIDFWVEQSDYFKLFGDVATLYDDGSSPLYPSTISSFNIKIEVDEKTLRDEGEAVGAHAFAEGINKSNSTYFSLGSGEKAFKKLNKGDVINFQEGQVGSMEGSVLGHDGFFFSLNCNIGEDKKLRAGRYRITIVCTDQLYEVETFTRVIPQRDVENGEEDLNDLVESFKGTQYEESDSRISTTFSNGTSTSKTGISFDSKVTFSTQTTTDHGYVFYRWLMRSEEQNQIYSSSSLSGTFGKFYQKSENPTEKYKLQAYAVYRRKQVEIRLSDRAFLEQSLLSAAQVSQREVNFAMNPLTYEYGTKNNPESLTLSMDGPNKTGYYLSGYKVLDENGRELNSSIYTKYTSHSGDTLTQITIDTTWVKNAIKNGQIVQDGLVETFYIVPIFECKTITIHFHSGTGKDNEYGDKRDGKVRDINKNETTNKTYDYVNGGKFGEYLALDGYVPSGQNLTIDQIYYSRDNYPLREDGSWKWKTADREGIVIGSALTFTSQMFKENEKTADMHVFRLWMANQYQIIFHANGGSFGNGITEKSVTVTFEQTTDTEFKTMVEENITHAISRAGYSLAGWTLQENGGDVVLAADGSPSEMCTFFKDGVFVFEGNAHVFAKWEEKSFEIEIFYNKAESVPGVAANKQSTRYTIAYDTKFSDFDFGGGITNIEAYTSDNVKRKGFIFDGVYALSASGRKTKIDNTYVFNSYFPSFADYDQEKIVPLYFAWRFDINYFELTAKNSLSPLDYTGKEQTVQLYDYFDGWEETTKGFVIHDRGEKLISLDDVNTILLDTKLASTSNAVAHETYFTVKESGNYSVHYTVTLSDMLTENQALNEYFNLGVLQTFEFNFMIRVNSALLDIGNFQDGLFLENVKKLVAPYLPNKNGGQSLRARLLAAESLQQAINVFKEFDNSVPSGQEEDDKKEIYAYLMTRYYLLTHTNETDTEKQVLSHALLKSWTYQDFEAYKEENTEEVQNIILRTYFFGFYNFASETRQLALVGQRKDYKDLVSIVTPDGEVPSGLTISRLEIRSETAPFEADERYDLRVYVTGTKDALQQYDLLDDGGQKYFVSREYFGYILPQIFTVQNTSADNQAYFASWYVNGREVPWMLSSSGKTINGRTYYSIGKIGRNQVYLYVSLRTSNIGQFDADTTYSFFDDDNYIYFSMVSVLMEDGGANRDITDDFKFVLDDEVEFYIKSTKNVASLVVSAKYLTNENGMRAINDMPETVSTNALAISSVKYKVNEKEGEFLGKDINRTGAFAAEGMLIFTVTANNANRVEIFVSDLVTEVTFSVDSLNLGMFVSLLRWSQDLSPSTFEVTGVMEKNTSHVVTQEEIKNLSQDATYEVATMEYYAIFTDLVKVTYDLNFPEEYSGTKSYGSTLKLGTTLDESILPYETGLGRASKMFIREDDGSETKEYTTLNNVVMNGTTVFGGWDNVSDAAGNTFRFKPITFSAKWSLPKEIEYTRLLGEDEKVPVYSYFGATLSVYDMIWMPETNNDMFDYDYSWKVEYADNTPAEEFSGYTIDLRGEGGRSASGTYTLTIKRRVKQLFIDAKTFDEEATKEVSATITSKITFMPYLISEVQKPDKTSVVYDGAEHRDDIVIMVKYRTFSRDTQEYDEGVLYKVQYSETGLFTFTITYKDAEVTSVVDVGDYYVTMHFMEDMFDFDEGVSEEDVSFIFRVTPVDFDLSSVQTEFAFSKRFNDVEPVLETMVEVAPGIVVTLQFSREQGEDIGEKELYFENVLADNNVNFTFKYNGITLFENGEKVENGRRISVGTFTITQSGTLQIDLEGDCMKDRRVTKTYSGTATTLEVDEFTLKLRSDDEKTLNMLLRDVTKGEDLTEKDRKEILDILRSKMSSLKAYFFSAVQLPSVTDVGIYTYQFDVTGTPLASYYANVTILSNYRYEITPYEISLQGQCFDKEFDGTNTKIFDISSICDTSGVAISGLQARVTYASVHASEKVTIASVELIGENLSVNLDNFAIKEFPSYAEIFKLVATLTLETKNDEGETGIEYGKVTAGNLAEYLIPSALVRTKGGEVLDLGLLMQGYYNLDFEIVSEGWTNSRGFLFKGEYDAKDSTESGSETGRGLIEIVATFDDFEMTINDISFEITQKTVQFEIPEEFRTITTLAKVAEFYEHDYLVTETGDELTLHFVLADESQKTGEKLSEGKYALKLQEDYDYAAEIKESIKVEINENNFGLNVISQTGMIVLTITDGQDLTGEYNGDEWTISDCSPTSFKIKNGSTEKTVTFSASCDAEGVDFDPQSLTYTATFEKEAIKVGRYRIVLQGNDETGEGNNGLVVVFADDYHFEITKKQIHAADLENKFNKQYDGSRSAGPISEFNGKVEGDEVTISGLFEDANASESPKKVYLFGFDGADAYCYALDGNETKSMISKAKAKIALADIEGESAEFEYGTLTKDNLVADLGLVVMVNEEVLMPSLFQLKFECAEITEDSYSVRGFLKVKDKNGDAYSITISAEGTSSTNYDFEPLHAIIKVVPHEISLRVTEIIKSIEIGSEEWKQIEDDNVDYTIPATMNDLVESVPVKLKVENLTASSKSVGRYRLASTGSISLDKNYVLKAVSDETEEGGFEITKQITTLFALVDNDDATENIDRISLSTEYDGKEYDQIVLKEEDGGWVLYLKNSSTLEEKKLQKLGFYTLVGDSYVKYSGDVKDLTAQFKLPTVHYVTGDNPIGILVSEEQSSSHDVRFGLNVPIDNSYDFILTVTKKKLTFKESIIKETFNNREAIYDYDAIRTAELLDGIMSGDALSMRVTFKDGEGNTPKYHSSLKYAVEAQLFGNHSDQYDVEIKDGKGEVVQGEIGKAKVEVRFYSKSVTYGDDTELIEGRDYVFDFGNIQDFDLDVYRADNRKFDFSCTIENKDSNLSTTKHLCVGSYTVTVELLDDENCDFELETILVDGERDETTTQRPVLIVTPREIHISSKNGKSLKEIFTKNFDGTLEAKIFADGEGRENSDLLFSVSNILSIDENGIIFDDVKFARAEYSTLRGVGLVVTFYLDENCKDSKNYSVEQFLSGVVNSVKILIRFEYEQDQNIQTNVEGEIISALAYPFMENTAYLTSNSYDPNTASTKNFPSVLTGKKGNTFAYWTLQIDLSEEQETRAKQIEKLKEVMEKSGARLMEGDLSDLTTDDIKAVHFIVGNDYVTVQLLSELLSDSEDILGMYYTKGQDFEIVFHDHWEPLTYSLQIVAADEYGESTTKPLGNISSDSLQDADVSCTESFEQKDFFTYGENNLIDLLIKPNAHAKLFAVYVNGEQLASMEDLQEDGKEFELEDVAKFKFTSQNDGILLAVTEISADLSFEIRFRAQRVKITLDLEEEIKNEIQIENNIFDSNYVWQTDYFDIQDFTLDQLPTLTLYGRNLVGYTLSGEEVLSDEFAETKLIDDGQTEDAEIILRPMFEPKTIEVVLNLGYDDQTKTIFVKFQAEFSTAVDDEGNNAWSESISRVGFDFMGWFDGDEQIFGSSVLQEESKTLTAHWERKKLNVQITLEHIEVMDAGDLTLDENVLSGQQLEYEQEITFVIKALRGYELPEQFDDRFDTTYYPNGTVELSFNIGGEDFVATITATPLDNIVEFSGQQIGAVDIFDTTDGKTPITDLQGEEGEKYFLLQTGKKITFEVSADFGFDISEDVTFQDLRGYNLGNLASNGLTVDKQIDSDGKLILTVEGISFDLAVIFHAEPIENNIIVDFDVPGSVQSVTIGQREFQNPDSSVIGVAWTLEDIYLTIAFNFGYEFGSVTVEDALDPTRVQTTPYEKLGDTYRMMLTNIYSDVYVHVTANRKTYSVTLNATSYNGDNQKEENEQNKVFALINGEEKETFAAEYGSQVTLKFKNAPSYEFRGWSSDGESAFDPSEWEQNGFSNENGIWTLTILRNAQYWGIFTQGDYPIVLKTMDYSYYKDMGIENIEEEYVEIDGEYFELNGEELSGFDIFYGGQKKLLFNVPDGYMFYGYGFFDPDLKFQIVGEGLRQERQVEVTINTLDFGSTFVKDLYMVVVAYASTIQVSSMIDFSGVLDNDIDVGGVELCNKDGEGVNDFGYVSGTRVHYEKECFAGTLKDKRNFAFVAYTQVFGVARDEIYLKVQAARKGYYFDRLEAVGADLSFQELSVAEDGSIIFKVFGLVGGTQGIEILVIYAPNLHAIELSFVHNDYIAAGGLFEAQQADAQIKKLWTSGNGYSSITVSAFTDVRFTVTAYVRAGFFIDSQALEDCIIDPENIVVSGTIRYTPLTIKETGFTGMITFDVKDFEGISEIKIRLQNSNYTIVFKDDARVLAKVRNVGFNTSLQQHLLQINSANIESTLGYVDGHLNLVRELPEHYFAGYFTNQNGSGKQYIASSGLAVGSWLESGYVYNPITGYYDLQNGTIINDDNEIEIPLYLYMSYYKTRIHFEFSPDINTNITAQQIVSGVDSTSSWYYFTNPSYIEIAFNTDIYITAPEINGYKFYKFIVNQKTFDGTWLTPVVFFQDKIPWSTNEVDQIVECDVQICYFAQLDVRVIGGEGSVLIEQEVSDAQAESLLKEGYFDTSKSFKVTALPDYGFNFDHWLFAGLAINDISFETNSPNYTTIYLYLTGSGVVLDFKDYDVQKGQISSLRILSMIGIERDVNPMVTRIGGRYQKLIETVSVAVGDIVTFALTIDSETAVQWNLDAITYQGFSNGKTYFSLKIIGEYAENDAILKIIPEFNAAKRVVYITSMFADDEVLDRALDRNLVESVLVTKYGGVATNTVSINRGADIEIVLEMLPRYDIKNIVVESFGKTFANKEDFIFDNKIVLREQFMTENDFGGNIFIRLQVTRLMWEDYRPETQKLEGFGTEKEPYHIKNLDDLVLMMKFVNNGTVNELGVQYRNCSFILDADLDLGEKFWTPIGTFMSSFNGTFNFNRHIVTHIGLAILYDEISYDGLFGVLGANARIITGESFWWWLILIIVLVILLLLLLLYMVYRNKRKQKVNDELAKN